ncbi:Zinc/iron permease [Phytophthora cactorum]|nr:Zinc/iron permease [Phytophthora cactorum]
MADTTISVAVSLSFFLVDLVAMVHSDGLRNLLTLRQSRLMDYGHHVFGLYWGLVLLVNEETVCDASFGNPYVWIQTNEVSTGFYNWYRLTDSTVAGTLFVSSFFLSRVVFNTVYIIPRVIKQCHHCMCWAGCCASDKLCHKGTPITGKHRVEEENKKGSVLHATSRATVGDRTEPVHYSRMVHDSAAADHPAHDTKLRRKIATLIFEAGVIFHSVIIGLDLGVTTGSEFNTLLAALCFHQFFEGSKGKLFMVNFAFAITTPVGQVIGIAIRTTYSDSSTTALWVQGILDCVAGGILLYTGLVELLTYNMTTNGQFLSRPTVQAGLQCVSLYICLWLGAGLMTLIGP